MKWTPVMMISSMLTVVASGLHAEPMPEKLTDIVYAKVDDIELKLDLYRPQDEKGNLPTVIWVHGGAWRSGSKDRMPLGFLVQKGYAVASVDYRLSPVARFPAQAHDLHAAIRFLRGSAEKYRLDKGRFAIAGSSAGGHLAALVGVTSDVSDLTGQLGSFLGQSSEVDSIIDYYGPTNFHTILKQSTPHGLSVRVPAIELLIGGRPEQNQQLASLASVTEHIDSQDPPLLMIHGDQDPQVPINQSHELHDRYKQNKLDATFEVVHGGAHGGPAFYDQTRRGLVIDFLQRTLQ